MQAALRMLVGAIILPTLVAISVAQEYGPPQQPFPQPEAGGNYAPSRWSVGASLLYLKPGAGNLEYGTLVNPLPAASPHWVSQAIEPDYSPAFDVALRYDVSEIGVDIRTNWTHLDTSDEHSFVADIIQFAGPPYQIGPDANLYNLARGTVDFTYDAINLDAGYTIGSGGPAQVRIFGGIQFANIDQTLTGDFSSFNGSERISNTMQTSFFGAGPRMGILGELVGERFDFVGQMSVAALIGTMESRMDYSTVSANLPPGTPSPNLQSLTSPNVTQVVPAIETKLGTGYTFGGRHCGCFRVEGGYQASVYFNAINQYTITNVDLPSNVQSIGVFLRTADHLQTNFFAHGPYVSATWTF